MDYLLIGYEGCSTCKKAKAWLKAHGMTEPMRPIKEETPTAEELSLWMEKAGLPIKSWLNTHGESYRKGEFSKRLPDMSREEVVAAMAADGMLIKRPILILPHTVLLGFQEARWEEAFDFETVKK